MLVPRTNLPIFFTFFYQSHKFVDFCKIFSFPFPPFSVHSLSLQLHWGVLSLLSLPPFSLLVKLGLRRIWRECSWPLDICTYYVYVIRIRILICLKLAFRRTLLRSVSSKDQFQGEVLPLASPLFKGLRPKRKNAVFTMNAAFLLSLKQYVILYLYVVLTYFMCTFPKKTQKFCDLLLNRNLHTVSIPQIYHLWKGSWALPLPNHSTQWK